MGKTTTSPVTKSHQRYRSATASPSLHFFVFRKPAFAFLVMWMQLTPLSPSYLDRIFFLVESTKPTRCSTDYNPAIPIYHNKKCAYAFSLPVSVLPCKKIALLGRLQKSENWKPGDNRASICFEKVLKIFSPPRNFRLQQCGRKWETTNVICFKYKIEGVTRIWAQGACKSCMIFERLTQFCTKREPQMVELIIKTSGKWFVGKRVSTYV